MLPIDNPPTPPTFPITRWSLVTQSRQDHPGAMEELCRMYWQPLFALARSSGLNVEDAEDVTQRFFHDLSADRSRILSETSPEDGKLRTWFRRILEHRIVDHLRHANRLKRGGGNLVSLEAHEEATGTATQAPHHENPARAFDRQWALQVIHLALLRYKRDFIAAGRETHFEALSPFLGMGDHVGDYAHLQNALHLTESAARQTVHRFRERFRRHLRAEIAETLANPDEAAIDAELESLKIALAGE